MQVCLLNELIFEKITCFLQKQDSFSISLLDRKIRTLYQDVHTSTVACLKISCTDSYECISPTVLKYKNLKSLNLRMVINPNYIRSLIDVKDVLQRLQCLTFSKIVKIQKEDINELLKAVPSLESLNFSFTDIKDIIISIVSRYRGIKSLDLITCKHLTNSAAIYLAQMIDLRELNLSLNENFDDRFLQYLSFATLLNTLDISYNEKITDAGIEWVSKIPTLKTLIMKACKKATKEGLRFIQANNPNIECIDAARCSLIEGDLGDVLSSLYSLKTICLKGCKEMSMNVIPWNHIKTLTNVNLSYCRIETAHLQQLSVLPLVVLNLNTCIGVDDEGLNHLCGNLTLEDVNLFNCVNITDVSALYLSTIKSLKTLILTNCYLITNRGLEFLSMLLNLIHINLSYCYLITNIEFLVSKCLFLQYINLSGCFYDINLLIPEINKLKYLQELNLNECRSVFTIRRSIIEIKSLIEVINFSDYVLLQNDDVITIAALSALRVLKLKGCIQLTDLAVKAIAENSSIEDLDLEGVFKITDLALKELADKKTCINIINLSKCMLLTDIAMHFLAKCKFLMSIQIEGCFLITDNGVKQLLFNPYLIILDVSNCISLTRALIFYLFIYNNFIKKLNIKGCVRINQNAIEILQQYTSIQIEA